LTIVTYSAEPGSASETALRALRKWSDTHAKLSVVGAERQAGTAVGDHKILGFGEELAGEEVSGSRT
jgi:hypothetical protein